MNPSRLKTKKENLVLIYSSISIARANTRWIVIVVHSGSIGFNRE